MTKEIQLQYTIVTSPVPDFIYDGIKQYSRDANRYQLQPKELVTKLSEKHGVPAEMIYLTAGADEGIQMCALAYGQSTYIFTPTYGTYKDMSDFNANIHQIDALKDNNYVVPTETIEDATLIYIANPNNPFGSTHKDNLTQLIKNNPQAMVVVDEVYAEYSDLSILPQVNEFLNLVVLRSFSKAYAMAGNRIGFMVAHPEVIQKVKNKAQWSNLSYLSVGAAMTALDHEDYFENLRAEIVTRRNTLNDVLSEKGFVVLPSYINAVLIKFNTEAQSADFYQYLATNGILTSHGNGGSNVGLDKSFIRIAIGTEEENEILTKLIADYH